MTVGLTLQLTPLFVYTYPSRAPEGRVEEISKFCLRTRRSGVRAPRRASLTCPSFSPKASHAIAFERCFITDDRYILGLSLGDEHTVKWVLVGARQQSSPNTML